MNCCIGKVPQRGIEGTIDRKLDTHASFFFGHILIIRAITPYGQLQVMKYGWTSIIASVVILSLFSMTGAFLQEDVSLKY